MRKFSMHPLAEIIPPRRGAESQRLKEKIELHDAPDPVWIHEGRISSNALAQEKTGEFWVDHRLFGIGLSGSYQQAEVAVFVGKNPWQSHGFQHARPK